MALPFLASGGLIYRHIYRLVYLGLYKYGVRGVYATVSTTVTRHIFTNVHALFGIWANLSLACLSSIVFENPLKTWGIHKVIYLA